MTPEHPELPDGRSFTLQGSEVARLRRRHGWSREILANKIGVSKKTIVNIEIRVGKRVLYKTLEKLAKIFVVEPYTLLAVPAEPQANGHPAPHQEAEPPVGPTEFEAKDHAESSVGKLVRADEDEIESIFGSWYPRTSMHVMCDAFLFRNELNDMMISWIINLFGPLRTASKIGESIALGQPAFFLLREDVKEDIASGKCKLHFFHSPEENEDMNFWGIGAISTSIYDVYSEAILSWEDLIKNKSDEILIVAFGRAEPSGEVKAALRGYYGAVSNMP